MEILYNYRKLRKLLVALLMVVLAQVYTVSASFNLFIGKSETQKLHGLSSDIFYVREGVVNDYALNFVVTLPPEIDQLHFFWQATSKRTVHYELLIEFTDFFALLQPNISIGNVGRVPHKLESFKITLPCSGRINSEVNVNIKFIFSVKYTKPNITTVNLKRNKVCLQKELPLKELLPDSKNSNGDFVDDPGAMSNTNSTTILILSDQTTPSLLLAGLLGGCLVSASIVFLGFFIFLRRKLQSSSPSSPTLSDPNSSHHNSPASLLRNGSMDNRHSHHHHNQIPTLQWDTKEKSFTTTTNNSSRIPRSNSRNSYVTIASSFWHDIFNTNNNTTRSPQTRIPSSHANANGSIGLEYESNNVVNGWANVAGKQTNQSSTNSTNKTKTSSDVSPYAYAHVNVFGQAPPPPSYPPPPPTVQNPPSSFEHREIKGLIDWYSEFPGSRASPNPSATGTGMMQNLTKNDHNHVYSNNLFTFKEPSHQSPRYGDNRNKSGTNKFSESGGSGRDTLNSLKSGSESLIQVDGYQLRKNLIKEARETHVVERFL